MLDEGTRSKKQPLNETELALRREETARKRKNLSEKKLEDEKAETINRLLKKQSRPKNKRTNTLDDRSPMPLAKVKPGDDDAEAEYDEDAMDVVEQPEEVKPIMYRWVSSLREVPVEGGERRIEMGITFSVPENVIPQPSDKTDIIPDENQKKIQAARGPGVCAVEGCGKPRKYRLPRDWTIGACDSTHLRILAN
jgi:Ino eighty subunit 2